jgi:thiol:disulfide interchange protein DsbD
MKIFCGVLVVSVMFATRSVFAQSNATVGPVTASIHFGPRMADGAREIALHFVLKPEWHLYWTNPGDAGLPLEISWTLPPGYRIDTVRYPVPKRYVSETSIDFGYPDSVTVLATLRSPERTSSDTAGIVVGLDWLVCKESCIQGSTTLRARLNDPSTRWTFSRVARAERMMPAPWRDTGDLRFGTLSIMRGEHRTELRIPFSGPNASRVKDFYPELIPDCTIIHSEIEVKNNEIIVPVTPNTDTIAPERLSGLIRLTDGTFTLSRTR